MRMFYLNIIVQMFYTDPLLTAILGTRIFSCDHATLKEALFVSVSVHGDQVKKCDSVYSGAPPKCTR